jgi:hypothetical protein
MRDGIYKVRLSCGDRKGFVIGALNDGRMTGCDQTHHVTGQVKRDGGHLGGTLVMTRHSRPPGFVEIANLDTITVRFAGICGDGFGEFECKILEKPELPVTATFQRLCDF